MIAHGSLLLSLLGVALLSCHCLDSIYVALKSINSAPALEDSEKKATGTGGSGKVEDEDVKLVVAQTGCTEEAARSALEAENGDLINASE